MSIKIMTVAAVAATAAGLLTPMTASAQRGGGGNIPGGSYAQSCSDISVRGGRLYAECRDTRRGTQTSSLDIGACGGGDIGNDNGLLVCGNQRGRFESGNGGNNGGGWGGNDGRPGGGRPGDGRPNNGGPNGGWNGNGGNNGGGWGGQGGGSITVYRDANFRGQSQSFDGEISNLGRTGLNDAISSMRMRGRWEACTDSNFRGQCMEFDGEVSNLSRFRMNDSISSLRPVRGGGGRW